MGFSRLTVAVGALLLWRAGLTVVRGRRALTGAGEGAEGFSLPWTAVFQAIVGCCICILGLMRHLGGLRPIRQVAGKPMRWDTLHERPGFRNMYTRIRYVLPVLEKYESSGKALHSHQTHPTCREDPVAKKKQ